jgi:PKD repeat protein
LPFLGLASFPLLPIRNIKLFQPEEKWVVINPIAVSLLLAVVFILLPVRPSSADPLFGPDSYARETGAPNVYEESFVNCEPAAKYHITLQNGDSNGDRRVSSASVALNGNVVIVEDELNQNVEIIEKEIAVESENDLNITVAGTPLGYITVSVECVENCFQVFIDSPLPGATVDQDRILVHGTVLSGDNEVGVLVNTQTGFVSGPPYTFAAPDVPLSQGPNTLTAVATNHCGMQATAVADLMVGEPLEPTVLLMQIPSSGVAPLEVNFKALAIPPNPVSGYEWNFNADTDSETTNLYLVPGLYFPSVTVHDSEGLAYSTTGVVHVMDTDQLDIRLKEKWNGMREALIQGDDEGALEYFTGGSKDRYRKIFEALGDGISEIGQNLEDVVLVAFQGSTAKYRIQREELVEGQPKLLTYWVYFIQDTDGIWRIKQF